MSAHNTPARWYCVGRDGLATLCKDEADALANAKGADVLYARQAPHRAVMLGDVAAERGARIEAQRQVEQLQERIKRADVETAKAVAAERERCAVDAWNHYMDTCHKTGKAPSIWHEWCAADAIRKGDAA